MNTSEFLGQLEYKGRTQQAYMDLKTDSKTNKWVGELVFRYGPSSDIVFTIRVPTEGEARKGVLGRLKVLREK